MTQWIARLTRLHILILILSVATFLTTFAYLQSLDEKIAVAVMAKDINAGELIDEDSIEYIEISSDEKVVDYFFTTDDFTKLVLVARVDLQANEFLNKSNTVRSIDDSGNQSMSIGVEINNANGGNIKRGDIIDIWQTGENSKLIASQVNVRKVIEPDKRLGVATSQTITLVLSVNTTQASQLSKVVNSRDIMVVLSNGVSPSKQELESLSSSPGNFEPIEIQGLVEN